MTVPSLRIRLTLWFAASIMLIVAPVLAVLLTLQWRAMHDALDHHLAEDLEVVAQMLGVREETLIWRAESAHDPGYDAGPQRWVEVYTAGGQLVFTRGLAAREDIRAAFDPPAPATQGYRTFQTPAGAHVRSLTVQRPFGSALYWVRVVRTEDDLRHDLRQLVIFFALVTPLAVLAAAISGYMIAGRALSPLARMAERARVISVESLSERLPVETPHDELGQLATVFNDTFARLDASFARLKQFTADASHELRTPLTAIRSVGEVGLREARSVEAYREVIGSMLEEADHLAGLVDRLLTLSRWESGRVKPAPEPVDLRQLADDVVGQLAVLAEDRQVRVEVSVPAGLIASTDRAMARQAVVNVLDNAIKYTPDGGRVRVTGTAGQECRLIVDDEGPGIPEHERRRVLERFYRAEAATERAPGTGLGLAIVQQAMTANRGQVVIDKSDMGGARVALVWPTAPRS